MQRSKSLCSTSQTVIGVGHTRKNPNKMYQVDIGVESYICIYVSCIAMQN